VQLGLRIGQNVGRGRGNPQICLGQAFTLTPGSGVKKPFDTPSSWDIQSLHRSLSDRRFHSRHPDSHGARTNKATA
jgi:hypothetical protein